MTVKELRIKLDSLADDIKIKVENRYAQEIEEVIDAHLDTYLEETIYVIVSTN